METGREKRGQITTLSLRAERRKNAKERKRTRQRNGGERAVKTKLWLFARFARLRP